MKDKKVGVGVGLAGRCGFALLAISIILLPLSLVTDFIDLAKFTAIITVWLLVAGLLIFGSDVTEVTLWKASIRRDARSAERDAKAAREALEGAEEVRRELREVTKRIVECSYISLVSSPMVFSESPMSTRFQDNLDFITSIIEPDPVRAGQWQEEVKAIIRSS